MAAHVEIERKYEVDGSFVLPDLCGLPGCAGVSEPEERQLAASYYDTEDLRLAAYGVTLRRRRGGADAGWHLKLPIQPGMRQEIRAPLGRGSSVPPKLARLVRAYVRGGELRQIGELETRRTVVRVLDGSGVPLAELADDAVSGRLVGRPKGTAPLSWREVEVELAAGGPELLERADRVLRRAGARPSTAQSKIGRLLDGQVPARAGKGAPATAGEVVVAYLAAQVDALVAVDPQVRLAAEDSVHRMRVATRRIRSILRSFQRLFEPERTARLADELRWLADGLGAVRDLEVLRERFVGRLDDAAAVLAPARAHPAAEPAWLAELQAGEQAARRRLSQLLSRPRYLALLDELEAFVADPPYTARAGRGPAKQLRAVVSQSWQRTQRAWAVAEGLPESEERELARHRARRTAKRARYTAEAAEPVLGRAARDLARQAERLQEALGGYQDSLVAQRHLIAAVGSGPAVADALALGLLLGAERCAAVESLRAVDTAWQKASRGRHLRRLMA